MNFPRVAAVVLAAGSSSRLGRPKQLVEFEGKTLLRRTVETVVASSVDLVVVTTSDNGVDFDEELNGLDWTRSWVEQAHLGQSESIRAGLSVVEKHGNFDAILFTPCDLPLLSVSHLNVLLSQYRGGSWSIAASRYDGVLGAPLIVGRQLWPELQALRGDVGARKILPAYLETTVSIEWDGGRFDIDTLDDVVALQRKVVP